MTKPPPLTREARNWLVAHIHCDTDRRLVNEMPAPSDPLDAVRARFQSKTRGGYEYALSEVAEDRIWGRINLPKTGWCPMDWALNGSYFQTAQQKPYEYDLLPVSPHAALIAELRKVENNNWLPSIHMDLIKRAADALEKQP